MTDFWGEKATFRLRDYISVKEGNICFGRIATDEEQISVDEKRIQQHFSNLCGLTKRQLILTGAQKQGIDIKYLEEDELAEGEIAACVFNLDGYEIKSAARIYMKTTPNIAIPDMLPATKEQISEFYKHSVIFTENCIFRHAHEISARYINYNQTSFTHIASAVESNSWDEGIAFIGTAREDIATQVKDPILFVKKAGIGSSFSADEWYAMFSNGTISKYVRHDMSSDNKKIWNLG
jgi:hypothetical protein